MNMEMKMKFASAALLLTVLAASCSTTGGYMPLADGDVVIGTVQDTLIVKSTFFSMQSAKNAINTEAYIKLLDAAEKKYSGNIDIRDIVWVTGRMADNDPTATEIFATGKVIRVGSTESESLPEAEETEDTPIE